MVLILSYLTKSFYTHIQCNSMPHAVFAKEKVKSLVTLIGIEVRSLIYLIDKKNNICIQYNGSSIPHTFRVITSNEAKVKISYLEELEKQKRKYIIAIPVSTKKFQNVYKTFTKYRDLINRFFDATRDEQYDGCVRDFSDLLEKL